MYEWFNVVVCTIDGKDKDYEEVDTGNLKPRTSCICLGGDTCQKLITLVHIKKKNYNAFTSSVSFTKVTWSSILALQPTCVDCPMDSRITYKEVGLEC